MANPSWTRGRFLGRGSTATVSLASKHPSGDLFAVKSTLLSDSQLLRREKDIHSSVSSPHIISYLGYEVTDDRCGQLFNLFLEYAPNGSLSDEIKRSKLEEIDIRSYAKDVLLGLSHLHSMGIAHCDVKPQNVLIGHDHRAKISDLGCARFVNCCHGDDTWRFMGTPMYMAPEVARGEKQGLEADVWALGCTIIEMAMGRPPWRDMEDAGAVLYRVGFGNDVPESPDWISEEGKDFLGKCLRREVEERRSVDELLMHPFLSNLSSPKSILDMNYWDISLEVDEEEREEERVDSPSTRSNSINELFSCRDGPNWTWAEYWITVRIIGDESSTGENVCVGNGTISTGPNQGDIRHDSDNISGSYVGDGVISCTNCTYVQTDSTDSDESVDQVGRASTSSSEEFEFSANQGNTGELHPDSNNISVVISDGREGDGEISSDNCNSLTIGDKCERNGVLRYESCNFVMIHLISNWIFVVLPVVTLLLLSDMHISVHNSLANENKGTLIKDLNTLVVLSLKGNFGWLRLS